MEATKSWREALDKKEHKNWVMVGCALDITKNGIAPLIQRKMEAWYETLISSSPLKSLSLCTCELGSNCGTCSTWKDELKRLRSSGQLKWNNSDRSQWGSPTGTWEIAKIYMSALGTRKTEVVNAETTDSGGLLNLLEFCPFIHPPVSPTIVASARDQCRNRWTHAPKQELQDADVKTIFGHLHDLLNDAVFSSDKDAQKSSKDLQDLHTNGLVNVLDSELKALRLLRQSLVADVTKVRDDLDVLTKKMAEAKQQGELNRDEIAKLRQQLETEVSNLQEKISTVKSTVEDFNRQLSERDDLKIDMQNIFPELDTLKAQISYLKDNLSSVANQAVTNAAAISSVTNQAATNATAIAGLQEEVFEVKETLKLKPLQVQNIDYSTAMYTAPARLTAFTGRETHLTWLVQNLTPQQSGENYAGTSCCTKTVCGLGGCGKTSVAVEFARKWENLFQGGVFWINGESDENIHVSVVENLALLNISASVDEKIDDTLNKFLAFLSNKKHPWLLVVDNADELEDGKCPTGVKKICKGPWQRKDSVSKHGHILLTTRQAVKETKTFLTLSPDDCLELNCFSENEGALFLMQRTGVKEKGLYQDAIDLVNELGALPLALEQAAAYISAVPIHISLKTYLEKYRAVKLSLLKQQPVTAVSIEAQYRLSVHTTWLMNLEFVRNESPAAETMLNIAAFVPEEENPIDIIYPILSELRQEEEESADCEFDMAATLKILCRYSLISVNEETNQFRVHKLVKEVVRERLASSMRDKIKKAVHKGLQKVATEESKASVLQKLATEESVAKLAISASLLAILLYRLEKKNQRQQAWQS